MSSEDSELISFCRIWEELLDLCSHGVIYLALLQDIELSIDEDLLCSMVIGWDVLNSCARSFVNDMYWHSV